MSDAPSWSEDDCTCGHAVSKHEDGAGRCRECDANRSWGRGGLCVRYQWNGEPRRRTW